MDSLHVWGPSILAVTSDANTLAQVSLALVPVWVLLLGGAGWWIKHERERREAIESEVSEKKYSAYMTLINIFFEVFKASKLKKGPPADLPTRMMDANKDLLIFGTDGVFLTYQAWTRSSSDGQKAMLHMVGAVILAIRRDMGHPKTKLTTDDVLRSFISDFDEEREKGRI
jgi:hypothetical protein